MFYYKPLFTFLCILFLFSLVGCTFNPQYQNLKQLLLLQDEINDIDGLDNPRIAKLNNEATQLFVVSADDDSLAVFDVSNDFDLSLSQVFKNDENITGLRGATKVAISKDGLFAYVVSFYDSALVIFKKGVDGKFYYQHTYSDNINWWEYKGKPIASSLQKLALLGAYDIEINDASDQIYIASSVSNAISIFNINTDGFPIFSHAIRDTDNINYNLEGTVDVLLSPSNSKLFAAGYNENAINIFLKQDKLKFNLSQRLINNTDGIKHLEKPLSMAISHDELYLYIACANGSIVIFTQNPKGKYSFLQSITDVGESVLAGAGNITISPDDKTIFVASESDNAISIFSKNNDGTLKYESAITSKKVHINTLLGASSVNVSPDGKYLLVTAGKGNSLSIFNLR
ncbi:hypothetical protein CJF42_12615 [Pseudoalteromonas sp. NBT06-2]|uniref:beta-propeller fold lactonase family protein n=1 Tax=Pseudoalteromonas sp. NBT06-2 TaxID=2025950 RepID=UPI000BA67DED|nr:beta-propeller fold lactonase family protein [Pseudoalteromonas sp. NBT06-2]PAJ74068.1 hypothetical protein CJF42_12615 [Pseudoalteromonas sp. NBT06-2]